MEKSIDFSILERFDFEYKPVGVKFLLVKPNGISKLDKKLTFCEMLKEAQNEDPFYTTKESHMCDAGPILLGMIDTDPIFESGQIGAKMGVYEDPRANRRVYSHISKAERGMINAVAFSSYDKLTFDPDLLIITAKPSQAEIILRASGYKTGAAWNAKGTSVMGCAWLYMYPYIQGEMNMLITGLHHGMKVTENFPEGLLLISIPFDKISGIMESLQQMEWYLPQYSGDKMSRLSKIFEYQKQAAGEFEAYIKSY